MRINQFVQQHINLEDKNIQSWLDIGTGNGLVAQEWRGIQNTPTKWAIDSGKFLECLDGRELMSALDNEWKKIVEPYCQESSVWNNNFDLITVMDSIQYYNKPDGEKVLDNVLRTGKIVIIFTPDGYYPDQGARSCWHKEEFEKKGMKVIIADGFHQGPPYPNSPILAIKE